MLRIDFVSLFPDLVLGALRHGVIARAESAGILRLAAVSPRDFATDKRKTVDDGPFGGGPGMVLRSDVLGCAIESCGLTPATRVVFADPAGERFDQVRAASLSAAMHVVIVCGRYEGLDERLAEEYATDRLSIGDYVLAGGELPAAVMAEAIARLVPGVLGEAESLEADSHSDGLLGPPQFTRPVEWKGRQVPAVLCSGDHAKVAQWRRRASLRSTRERRPDLFCSAPIDRDDLDLLEF